MKPGYFVLTPENQAPALHVLGTEVKVLASNAATQSFGITVQQGDEGTGPPPHFHDWDEAFYVLGGRIEFLCEDKTIMCAPGTLVFAPGGTVHGFRYGKGGGKMLEITGQNALAYRMFAAIDSEIPAGPPDFGKVVAVLGQNGVTVAA